MGGELNPSLLQAYHNLLKIKITTLRHTLVKQGIRVTLSEMTCKHFSVQESSIHRLRTELADKAFCFVDITADNYEEIPKRGDIVASHAVDSSLVLFLWVRDVNHMAPSEGSKKERLRLTLGMRLTKPKAIEPLQTA